MAKAPPNSNKHWTPRDVATLERLAEGNTPTGLIAWHLGRSEAAVRSKASDKRISLDPPNRSPYTRRGR